MIATTLNSGVLIQYLRDRFRRQPVSKSTLVMACHYFLKNECEPYSNDVEKIEDIITDLLDKGLLQKLTDGSIIVDNSNSI